MEFFVVVIKSMASRDRQCCLCRAVVNVKNTVHLFNASGLEKKWPSRIFTVLGVQVDERLSLVQDSLFFVSRLLRVMDFLHTCARCARAALRHLRRLF